LRRASSSSQDQRAGEQAELVDQVGGEQGLQKHVAALGQQYWPISLSQPGDLGCDVLGHLAEGPAEGIVLTDQPPARREDFAGLAAEQQVEGTGDGSPTRHRLGKFPEREAA
jgi:hypothetical protein